MAFTRSPVRSRPGPPTFPTILKDYGATPDRIRIKAKLDEKGQYWQGPFDYEAYDESTGEWIGVDGYHMTGARVDVVPYEP